MLDSGEESYYLTRLKFKTTNSEAEYKTQLVGLAIARMLGVAKVEVKTNSQVVVN